MPTNETVLVTGASSGIGLELAKVFAERGSNLILVARSADKLQELARIFNTHYGVQARAVVKDLTEPTAHQEIYDFLQTEGVPVHVLVNNAGIGARGAVAALSVERQLDIIRVNVTALTHLTRLFLPDLLKRGRGGILNVASMAAFTPGPNLTLYYASKAYVLSFTEGLAEELRGSGVTVTCLAPGPTATPFFGKADMTDTLLVRTGLMSAEEVAHEGYKGFRQGRVIVIPGARNKAGIAAIRFIPRFVMRKVTRLLNQ